MLFRRLRRTRRAITLVIASFGAALVLRNLLLFVYGGVPEYYSREIQVAIRLVPRDVLGGLRVTPDQLFVLGLTLAALRRRAAPLPHPHHARPGDAGGLPQP